MKELFDKKTDEMTVGESLKVTGLILVGSILLFPVTFVLCALSGLIIDKFEDCL